MLHSLNLFPGPIRFGTDGWRGVLGVDITIERLLQVASNSAQELAFTAPNGLESRKVVIGYDRRFLAKEFAEAIAAAVKGCDLEPLVTETALPTPACSWAVVKRKALGALVITASHNPPEWIGLKIKGPLGASVNGQFTKAVEKRILAGGINVPIEGNFEKFDGRGEHINDLSKKFDIPSLIKGLKKIGLKVIVDPMYGSASGCISEVFGDSGSNLIKEIRSNRDPLFGGNPPEPMPIYLGELIKEVIASNANGIKTIGLVFDGDGDRIAAIDEKGRFCSTQLLMPLLIDHLARVKNLPGSVLKTVSGSDLMSLVAKDLGRNVIELPVGFKYIAEKMITENILIGGEESGGIGFGMHIPERDALFTALLLLEALTEAGQTLGERLADLNKCYGCSFYDRIDIKLSSMQIKLKFEQLINSNMPLQISGNKIIEVIRKDGIKLRLADNHWLLFRFSGTEPLLRIYCEAPNKNKAQSTLEWAKNFAETYQ